MSVGVKHMRQGLVYGSSSLASSSRAVPRASIAPIVHPVGQNVAAGPSVVSRPARILRRHQSTSSSRWALSSFFSRRSPPHLSRGDGVEELREAVSAGDVEALRRAYDHLTASPVEVEAKDLDAALAFLSSSARGGGYKLFKRIYDDYAPRWGLPLALKQHRMLSQALNAIGRPRMAAAAASDFGIREPKLWREILKAAIQLDPEGVDEIWVLLSKTIPVSPAEYTLLLSHLHINLSDTSAIRERMTGILRDLREKGEWIGQAGEVELVYVQLKLGDLEKAEELVWGWELHRRDSSVMWNAALEVEMTKVQKGLESIDAMEELVRQMLGKRIKPTQRVVTFLVLQDLQRSLDARSKVGLEDVLRIVDGVEAMCKVKAGSPVWGEVIYLLSRSSAASEEPLALPLEVYHEAKSRGVEISSTIARNLIRPLCHTDPPDLLRAMAIYADWSASPLSINNSRDRERALDVYIPLLKACAATPSAQSTVIRLLTDLRSRGLPLPSAAAVSLAISLMRQSPDHASAFNTYAHFYALNGSALSSKDYDALLTSFLLLNTDKSPVAPPHLYLEIVKDMKRAGFSPSSRVISALLQSYGNQATRIRKSSADPDYAVSRLSKLEKSIVELHTVLKLDPLVNIDVPLLSSLMDAYNRVGAHGSAFEVWNDLVERRAREDPKSVKELYGAAISVVLDTCGYSDQLARARRIWAWAGRHGLRNPKHWETWVECLCRLGQMEEALEVVCRMRSGEAGAPVIGRDVGLAALELLGRFSMENAIEQGTRIRRVLAGEFPREWAEVSGGLARRAVDQGPRGDRI